MTKGADVSTGRLSQAQFIREEPETNQSRMQERVNRLVWTAVSAGLSRKKEVLHVAAPLFREASAARSSSACHKQTSRAGKPWT